MSKIDKSLTVGVEIEMTGLARIICDSPHELNFSKNVLC